MRRPLIAGAVLLLAYVLASAAVDPGGYLGTDTGAKVATLAEMDATGSWHPAVPYWAEAHDPEGRVHPIYDTERVDGRWVHVTTLPMLLAAKPLYELGGYRLALLLPMAGAIGVAFAARSLARRAAGDEAGWTAFWLVGLASPVTVYALDLWEHAPGVACMVGAIALLAGVLDGERLVPRALGAGALLGLAATMRTESFVYSLVAVGGCCLVLLRDRLPRDAVTVGGCAVGGFAVPWSVERGLEGALGGNDRAARATGAASAGLGEVGDRAREAVVTLLAARPASIGTILVVGGTLAGLVLGAVRLDRRGEGRAARACLVAAGALHVVLVADGLGFVPGMLVAAPLAVVALAQRPASRTTAYVVGVAVTALPLVWAFQYLGGASPQWAGRYALASCTLLVAAGVTVLPALDRAVRVGIVALAVLVTASGVAWLSERSHAVDRWFEAAAERPEDVLIARNGFFVREGGTAGTARRWLTAVGDEDLRLAVGVVADAGLRTFAIVDEAPEAPPTLGGARLVGTDVTHFLDATLYLHSYDLG